MSVRGVEAHARVHAAGTQPAYERAQLRWIRADQSARARHVLEQERDPNVRERPGLTQREHDLLARGIEAASHVRARMHHHRAQPGPVRGAQRARHHLDRARAKDRVRRRDVGEVWHVDVARKAARREQRTKPIQLFERQLGARITPVLIDEDLHGRRAHRDGAVHRARHAAGRRDLCADPRRVP